MLGRELLHIAVKVLRRKLVEGSLVVAFQGRPVLDGGHCTLAVRSGTGFLQCPALRVAHVGPLVAEVGFIHFNGIGEPVIILWYVRSCFPDPMQHEPCGLLADIQFPVQLHAGYRLQGSEAQVEVMTIYTVLFSSSGSL